MHLFNLLVVDDELEIVEWLYGLFCHKDNLEFPVDVHKAASGPEALLLLEQARYDVLVCDMRMPGVGGLQILERAKAICPLCRVIFLTGYREFDSMYAATRTDMVQYLLKTEDDAEILAAVNRALLQRYREKNVQTRSVEGLNGQLRRDRPIRRGSPWMHMLAQPQAANKTRLREREPQPAHNPMPRVMEDILQYIQTHLSENLSLAKLAQTFYFNPSYLSRLFKQITGQTLTDYIAQQKVIQAKHLLADPKLRISDISALLGYESGHYFSRFFKKGVGITPQEYRRRVQRLQQSPSTKAPPVPAQTPVSLE